MTATTLSDVIELIKNDDEQILENQEETNESLKSIDRNIKEFLEVQKRSRLDNLEKEREGRSSRLGSGLGGMAVGAGIGGALGGLGDAALGGGNAFKFIGAALGGYIAPKIYGALKSIVNGIINFSQDITNRIKKIKADADVRISEIDAEIRAKQGELETKRTKVPTESGDLNDPRTRAAEGDIRSQQVEADRQKAAKAEQRRLQAEISKLEQERMMQERLREDAIEAERRKGAERRRAAKALEKRQAALKTMREADAAAETKRVTTAQSDVDSFKRAEANAETNRALERARIGDAEAERFKRTADTTARGNASVEAERARIGDAEAERFKRAQQNNNVISLENERIRRQQTGDAELERFNRRAAAAEIPVEPRIKATTPPIGMEYDDAIMRQARTPTPAPSTPVATKPVPSRGRVKGLKAIGKAAAVVAAPVDVALSAALGGGEQVEKDVLQGEKSTINAVVASTAENLVGGAVGIIDLAANIANWGFDKVGQAITGDETFTVGRSDLATPAGEMAKNLVTSTGIGDETTIGGGTAGALLGAKQIVTGSASPQLESFIERAKYKKQVYRVMLNNGQITQQEYDARIKSEDERIARHREEIAYNADLQTAKRITYGEPTSVEKTTQLDTAQQSAAAAKAETSTQAPTIVDAKSSSNSDNSVNISQQINSGIQTIDPSAMVLPGYGYGSGPR